MLISTAVHYAGGIKTEHDEMNFIVLHLTSTAVELLSNINVFIYCTYSTELKLYISGQFRYFIVPYGRKL